MGKTDIDSTLNFLDGSAVLTAVERNDIEFLEILIDEGVDLNYKDINGNISLTKAILYKNSKIAKILINAGAKVSIKNYAGMTPLMSASFMLNIQITELLLKNGANPNIKDLDGNTALLYAFFSKHLPKNIDILIEINKLLLDAGANVNVKNKVGSNPLILASVRGYKEIVKMLIKSGADIEIQSINNMRALHAAVTKGNTEIVKILIDSVAKVNSEFINLLGDNITALTVAKLNQNREIVRILKNKGAKDPQAAKIFQNKVKNSCYIATMIYGSYDSPKVLVLRIFRDKVLKKSLIGKIFIWLYYFISPKIVKILKNKSRVNKVIKIVLDRLIYRIKRILY